MNDTNTDLDKMAVTESYEDVKGLIVDACAKASKRYHVEFDDLLGVAYQSFLNSYYIYYDESRGTSFSTWIAFSLRFDLINFVKKELKHRVGHEDIDSHDGDAEYMPIQRPSHFLFDLLDGLSQDARYVAKLTVDPPQEVLKDLQTNGKSNSPYRLMLRIKRFLEGAKWDKGRIRQTIDEIKLAVAATS